MCNKIDILRLASFRDMSPSGTCYPMFHFKSRFPKFFEFNRFFEVCLNFLTPTSTYASCGKNYQIKLNVKAKVNILW